MNPALVVLSYLLSSSLLALLGMLDKKARILDKLAILTSVLDAIFSYKVFVDAVGGGSVVYAVGGFSPPLGITYYVDFTNGLLSVTSSTGLILAVLLSLMIADRDTRKYFYVLAFLLVAGVQAFLYSGDFFHVYVAAELTAVSSYAITALYSGRKLAVRAAIIYGIAGTAVTSFLFLSVMIIYAAYGSVNIADVAMKSIDPTATTRFSGRAFGDILTPSKIALSLTTWAFLFKSGIVPNHFWLPRVYRATTLPGIILFVSSADVIGVYGLLRLYYVMFPEGSVMGAFRNFMLSLVLVASVVSAFYASTLVAIQRKLRDIVAYSTIAQLSLALLGFTAGSPWSITGGLMHLLVNMYGDSSVIIGYVVYKAASKTALKMLAGAVMILGFLNLFGLIPIVPGFWSKAMMVFGFLERGNLLATITVLVSTGLCAAGYFSFLIHTLTRSESKPLNVNAGITYPVILLALVATLLLSLGLVFVIARTSLDLLVQHARASTNAETYINKVLGFMGIG